MAAALPRLYTRRKRSVTEPVTEPVAWIRYPCTNPDEKEFPVVLQEDALRGEFELPIAGDFEWLLFSYT